MKYVPYQFRSWAQFKRWLWNLLIWIDQGANVILMCGDPDETISSVAGKNRHRNSGWRLFDRIINGLFGRRHTRESIESDEGASSLWK